MTDTYDDPDSFLVDAATLPVTRYLDEGRTTAELERRRVERNFRHAMADLVRQARTSANISQSDAATAWATQQPHVSRFEKDPGNAHAATLISYLAALGADIDINIRIADHRDNITIRDGEVHTAAELV